MSTINLGNWRYSTFTDTYNPEYISGEPHICNFHTEQDAYGFYLDEAPQETAPSTVSIVKSDSTEYTEVTRTVTPSAGEFRVDYDSETGTATGFVELTSGDEDELFYASYNGLGKTVKIDPDTGTTNLTIKNYIDSNASWVTSGGITVVTTTASGEILSGSESERISATSATVGAYAQKALTDIDLIDQGGMFDLKLDWLPTAYDSGMISPVIYDSVNDTEIEPLSIKYGENNLGFVKSHYKASFQLTNGTNSGYYVRLKSNHSSGTVSFSGVIDNIEFSPYENRYVSPITDWQSYTPTFQGLGTVTNIEFAYRRVGDSMEIMGRAQTGTVTGSEAQISLPLNHIINSSIESTDTFYVGECVREGNIGNRVIATAGDTFLNLSYDQTSPWGLTARTGSSVFISSENFSIRAVVPILGWSSNLTIADDAVVEYLYNSDTTNADDTSSFGYGADGGVVPDVSSTDKSKRVRAGRSLAGAKVTLQFQEDGSGPWIDVAESKFTSNILEDSGGYYYFGAYLENVSGSNTDLDVVFQNTGAYYQNGTGIIYWSSENAVGTRWRVKVVYNPSAVEAPENSRVVLLYDSKSSGTSGGTFTSGAWRTRDLNTLDDENNYGFCSLSSNQFTLQPGTYEIDWSAPAFYVNEHNTQLYNVSDSMTEKYGAASYSEAASGPKDQTRSSGMHILRISAAKTFEIKHQCASTQTNNGFGVAGVYGESIYAQVKIRKLK